MGLISLTALIRGQFKVARFRSRSSFWFWAKTITLGLGLAVLVFCSLRFDWMIVSSDGLIAGISIFAGGFLAAFTHLSTVRQTLNDRHAEQGAAERPERDLIDIAVTRLLGATLVSAATAAVLVVGTSVAVNAEGEVGEGSRRRPGLAHRSRWCSSCLRFPPSTVPTCK
ncbi:hypothetical protein G7066_08700 [Leucobacter coleopterorum]|uniref:Uncharacterized protein n=1 Tax=Leucobacter coleopterorum TaxID=2714933 RepID=A0ABX6JWJ3_9MICO|nr:hypothetical protein [Leucobacter coleopterorum]QIM18669.1 hypothetical protein G7066_08700 [Leucobacter coleopterorum]